MDGRVYYFFSVWDSCSSGGGGISFQGASSSNMKEMSHLGENVKGLQEEMTDSSESPVTHSRQKLWT